MKWTDLAHFLTLARAGSLRVAAREVGVAPTTVARRVEALERSLGTALLVRTNRGLSLTEAGRALAADAQDIEERFATLSRRFVPSPGARGTVRVSATEIVASHVVAPAIAALFAQHPGLSVVLRVDPRPVSFSRDEVDIAVRMVRPTAKSLVVRRVATVALGLFGSRSLRPRANHADGTGARYIGYDASYGRIPEVRWFEAQGLDSAMVLRTGSTRAILEATRAGAGIGLLPRFVARTYADLVELPMPSPLAPRGIYLVTHESMRKRPAIAAVWDHLVRTFVAIGEPPSAR